MEPVLAGQAVKQFANLEDFSPGRTVAARARVGRGNRRQFTGWSRNVVITTFITHEYRGGPWTTAVQGPIF